MKTNKIPEITLSDGRVVTVASNASVDSYGAFRNVLVGHPRSWEVAAQVKAGQDLGQAMAEVAAREDFKVGSKS